jgi:signal transduction histidine kinase
LIAEAVPHIWAQDPEDGRRLLEQVRQGTRSALAEMRTLLFELRPTGLADADLGDLLRQLGEAVAARSGISVHVDVAGESELPPEVHVALYRIAQEALNNVARHAGAGHAWVRFSSSPPRAGGNAIPMAQGGPVTLSIRDDGAGFDPDNVPPDHLGLGIMRERAEEVGATLTVESEPGRGTEIRVMWEAGAG